MWVWVLSLGTLRSPCALWSGGGGREKLGLGSLGPSQGRILIAAGRSPGGKPGLVTLARTLHTAAVGIPVSKGSERAIELPVIGREDH